MSTRRAFLHSGLAAPAALAAQTGGDASSMFDGTSLRGWRIAAGPPTAFFVDTGCIVGMTPNVNFEIQYVGKVKTALFGGEGLFFAKVTGPGTVWLQSLPFSRLASRVFAAAPQRGGSKDEGSVLGAGAIGGVLGGIFGDED